LRRIADNEGEEIMQIQIARFAQCFQHSRDIGLPISRGHRKSPHRQINVARRSSHLQTQFHRVAAFQQPWRVRFCEQAAEQSIECRLPTQALEVERFFLGHLS
jgi:hypothetical protein